MIIADDELKELHQKAVSISILTEDEAGRFFLKYYVYCFIYLFVHVALHIYYF